MTGYTLPTHAVCNTGLTTCVCGVYAVCMARQAPCVGMRTIEKKG